MDGFKKKKITHLRKPPPGWRKWILGQRLCSPIRHFPECQTFPRNKDFITHSIFAFLLLQTKKTIKRNIVLEKHVKFVISQDVEYSSLAGIVDAINKLNGKKKISDNTQFPIILQLEKTPLIKLHLFHLQKHLMPEWWFQFYRITFLLSNSTTLNHTVLLLIKTFL